MSAATFITVLILAAALISAGLFWSRRMIVQPLAIISSHFDSIAGGDLARPISVYGRNEISAIFASLKKMQTALRATVANVREGSVSMHTGISEIAAGNNDLSARTEQQAASLAETAASMEQLTATVAQNADNARQASVLSHGAAETARKGGEQTSRVSDTMHDIATSSQKIGGRGLNKAIDIVLPGGKGRLKRILGLLHRRGHKIRELVVFQPGCLML